MGKILGTSGIVGVLALALAVGAMADAGSGGGRTLFIRSAVEHADSTVTLPLHHGTSHGQNVYYIITETSDGNLSDSLGVNRSQKLANARGSSAVQKVTVSNGVVDFPATVDFSPARVLEAPNGFPPSRFQPGAVGEAGYSPLIQLPSGTIENAAQIARDQNGDGQITLLGEAADKVVSIDIAKSTVTYRETNGFVGDKANKYISTDSSNPLAATLEDATLAPALDAAPSAGDDSTASSRATLVAFVNGQTGSANPQRQGLNSAVAGDGDPLNVLAWDPGQGRYSPLWDVHLARWSNAVVAAGQNLRQTDVGTIRGLAEHGQIAAPDGSAFGASGFIVNCPIVSVLG
jgi:hypothetical protein